MDPNNGHQSSNSNQPYAWMRHALWANIPPDQFPSAPGPIVYEGFVPQQGQPPITFNSSQFDGNHQYGQNSIPDEHHSQYPPLVQDDLGMSTGHIPVPFNHSEMSVDENGLVDDLGAASGLDVDQTSNGGRERGKGRGRGRGRGRGTGRGPGRPKRERERGGWNRGTKTGLRPVMDPGDEFNTLHKEATDAFIDQQDYDKALDLILKAISINPEIYSAHVLLSEIYFARSDDERGVAALFSGAHATPNDPAVWHQLADVCLQRSSLDRFTMLKQASYCFQRLLQIDQQDYDARFQKAAISKELGHHAKALKDFEYLLQRMPHNSSVLRQIAELCLDLNDVGRAIGLYDDALEYQRLDGATDEDTFTWADLIVYVDLIARPNGPLKAMQVLRNISRRLLDRENEAYWEDFTMDDREWDADHTPRRILLPQFQPNLHTLDKYGIGLPLEIRVKLGDLRLRSGSREEALNHFEWLAPDERNEGSPLYEYSDLFLQVADALREVKEYAQALRYYEALYSINACDDVDFWLGFGACSYVCEKKEQALQCYEEAKAIDPTSGDARTQLSKLYAEKGEREKALLLARSAITIYQSLIPKTERRKYERKDLREARESAQKAYKDAYKMPKPQGQEDDMPRPQFTRRARAKARRLAKEAAEKAAAAEEDAEQAQAEGRRASLTPPGRQEGLQSREIAMKKMQKKRISKREKSAQDRFNTIRQLFSTLCSVTEAMRNGDDVARNVWMDCAEALVEEFRTERVFFPAERYVRFQGFDRSYLKAGHDNGDERSDAVQEDVPIPSIESSVPQDYCGIAFTNWLDVFLEYAVLLANMHEDGTECYIVIRAALDCNVWYHDQEAVFQIYTCWLACTVALRDEFTLFGTVIRWFMREFVFCTDTYRLFGALNFYFPHANDKAGKSGQMNSALFRSGPNQKHLFRQIMSLDSQLPVDYGSDQPDGPLPDFMRKPNSEVMYQSGQLPPNYDQNSLQTQAGSSDSDGDDTPGLPTTRGQGEQLAHRTFSPKELDVVLLSTYAQVLYAGGSFPNALSYFYRAYTVDPRNPVLLFSIALSYMHQMLKRQNENRHMYLLQGWSFFEEYADARIEWAEQKEKEGCEGLTVIARKEIEFNRARCWQTLGMHDLAIRTYGKMLDIKSIKKEDGTSSGIDSEHKELYSMEAAYAMTNMYAMSGDVQKAREITEKYLIIE